MTRLDELEGSPATAELRLDSPRELPTIDEYGLLRLGNRWVSLTPTEERVMRVLLERAGRVCSRVVASERVSSRPSRHCIAPSAEMRLMGVADPNLATRRSRVCSRR